MKNVESNGKKIEDVELFKQHCRMNMTHKLKNKWEKHVYQETISIKSYGKDRKV